MVHSRSAERLERHVGAHQQNRSPCVGQIRPFFGRRIAGEVGRIAYLELAAAGRRVHDRADRIEPQRVQSRAARLPTRQERRRGEEHALRVRHDEIAALVLSLRQHPNGLQCRLNLRPVEHGDEHTNRLGTIEAGLQRKRERHAHAAGQILHHRRSDPRFTAARRLQKLAIAHFAAAQCRQRGRDDGAGGIGHPELLRHVGIALRFLKELLNASVGVAGHRVVADKTDLRPDCEILMMIEQQPLELFVALHRQRLEIEADALFERASRNLIRDNADDGNRHQR